MQDMMKAFRGAIQLKGVYSSKVSNKQKVKRLLVIEKEYANYSVKEIAKSLLGDLVVSEITNIWFWVRKITNSLFFEVYQIVSDLGLALNALIALGAYLMRKYYEQAVETVHYSLREMLNTLTIEDLEKLLEMKKTQRKEDLSCC